MILEFKKFLLENKYISPDDVMNGGYSVAFIYNPDGTFLTGKYMHQQIIIDHPEIYKYNKKILTDNDEIEHRHWADQIIINLRRSGQALVGRIGEDIISFWNETSEIYRNYLLPCLTKIKQYKTEYIGRNTEISTPIFGTVSVVELLKNTEYYLNQKGKTSKEMDSLQDIHNLPADRKREILFSRGVMPKIRDKSLSPGVKKWAPDSE